MKTISFAAACITLLQFSAIAQPVANSSNVAANFHAEFYYTEATGFSPGSAGANQTWDYSDLEIIFLGTDNAIPVAGSPYAAQFPTANYLYKFHGIFGDSDSYFYHNLLPNKFEILSLGYDGENGDVFTPNPKTYVTFPYTYNTVFTDTYQTTAETSPTSFTATYDAYGTLIMPFGTFTNVIRQKVVSNGQTNYNWFNVSPFYPILQTVLEENTLGIVKDLTILGVDDNIAALKFSAYPNPVNDVVTINCPADFTGSVRVDLSDITGKTVITRAEMPAAGNSFSVDMQDCSAGIYFLKLTDVSTNSVSVQKLVKK
ncbi:MAG TPA: T9SS type A sorting domain-containing protein [Flavobacterium sp.]|jgi:hypothetical protein